MHVNQATRDPAHVCRLRVFFQHREVGSYPATYTFVHEGQDLVILDHQRPRRSVDRFADGAWSGAGVDIDCAYHDASPDCANCRGRG